MASPPQISTSRIASMNSPSGSDRNPYSEFKCWCLHFNTKEHAQLVGVLSFSLFLCLVVLSLFLFGSLSIFFISIGVVIYSFLMRSLFTLPEKVYVLAYLVFEAIQIGFYVALALYILMPLIMGPPMEEVCATRVPDKNGVYPPLKCELRQAEDIRGELARLLVCVVLLASVKLYFTRVFTKYYKYLTWAEKGGQHRQRALYVNGRDVSINMPPQDIYPSPPPFWPVDHPITREAGYSYSLNNNESGIAPVPTYNQVIDAHKPQQSTENTKNNQQQQSERPVEGSST